MSEKRFTLNLMKKPSEIEMDGKMISKYDVVRLLNEQQATINEYKENWDNLVEKASEIAKRNVVLDEKINEQQALINELQDTVYDELDKALKVLEEIYEDYPKNNVHRLYNNLKGLKEMIR